MSFKFEIRGFDKLERKIKTLVPEKEDAIEDLLIDFVTEVNAVQVRRAPIDKGFLRKSIFWSRVGKLQFGLFSNAPYAAYVEFGTGAGVSVPKGLEDYAIQFKGRGLKVVNLPARPYFFPPFLAKKQELLNDVDRILNK